MLCDRYMPEKAFPDKAIDVLDEVGAKTRISQYKGREGVSDLHSQLEIVIQKKEAAVVTQRFSDGTKYRSQEMEIRDKLVEYDKEHIEQQKREIKTLRITVDHVNL